mmetsp:Transcript_103724/g.293834  ORF Transcript_103724/g.293834 Transcript_103724/m.293834 type:complete len:245 (-) Transcript_103724:407-1141(-)
MTGRNSCERCSSQLCSSRSSGWSTSVRSDITSALADSSWTCLYGWATPSLRAGAMPRMMAMRASSEIAGLFRRSPTSITWMSRSFVTCVCEEAEFSPMLMGAKDGVTFSSPEGFVRKAARRRIAASSEASSRRGRRRRETPVRAYHTTNCQLLMLLSSEVRSASAARGPMAFQSSASWGSGHRRAARSVPAKTSRKSTWLSASLFGWACMFARSARRSSMTPVSPRCILNVTYVWKKAACCVHT